MLAQVENDRHKTDLVKILWIRKGWSPKWIKNRRKQISPKQERNLVTGLLREKNIFFSFQFEFWNSTWNLSLAIFIQKIRWLNYWISTPFALSDSKMIWRKISFPLHNIIIQNVIAWQRSIIFLSISVQIKTNCNLKTIKRNRFSTCIRKSFYINLFVPVVFFFLYYTFSH